MMCSSVSVSCFWLSSWEGGIGHFRQGGQDLLFRQGDIFHGYRETALEAFFVSHRGSLLESDCAETATENVGSKPTLLGSRYKGRHQNVMSGLVQLLAEKGIRADIDFAAQPA
jgi:hypothetical protein